MDENGAKSFNSQLKNPQEFRLHLFINSFFLSIFFFKFDISNIFFS